MLSVLEDERTNDRSLAMTSSFTNMVLTGQFLAHRADPAEYELTWGARRRSGSAVAQGCGTGFGSDVALVTREPALLDRARSPGAALESALKAARTDAGNVQTMTQSTLALRHGPWRRSTAIRYL